MIGKRIRNRTAFALLCLVGVLSGRGGFSEVELCVTPCTDPRELLVLVNLLAPKEGAPMMLLSEIDEVSIFGEEEEATYVQRLGVSLNLEEGKEAFSATVVDALPSGAKLQYPTISPMEVTALNGQKVRISWKEIPSGNGNGSMIEFRLEEVPRVNLHQRAACCGCVGCEEICSVKWLFKGKVARKVVNAPTLDLVPGPIGEAEDGSQRVAVRVAAKGLSEGSHVKVTVPRRLGKTLIMPVTESADAYVRKHIRHFTLEWQSHGDALEKRVQLRMERASQGELYLTDFATVVCSRPSGDYPPARCDGGGYRVQKMAGTQLAVTKDLVLRIP